MDLNKYNINDLNIKPDTKTKENFIRMAIVGPSDSGKSYLFKHIAEKCLLKHYDLIIVFCGSDDTRREYSECLKTDLVYSSYNPAVIDTLKTLQKKNFDKTGIMNSVLIVYDDYANRNTRYNSEIFDLAISGRHHCISFVMILHDLTCLDRIVRDNLSHLIITRQQAIKVYETIAEEYLFMTAATELDHLNTKKSINDYLISTLHNNTGNFKMVVVLLQKMKREPNKKLNNYIYWFKA